MSFSLKERLAELGIEPKKEFGQNFLVSPHVIGKIIAAVKAEAAPQLLEIGPGVGALTEHLLEAGNPLLIELDQPLIEYWQKRGFEVIAADALKLDWEKLDVKAGTLLVSNLPYQISSSLVMDRCFGPATIPLMILMFQKEVAERLMAKPHTKAYGLLSVMAQLHFKMSKVADAAPGDFFPPPKIASRVLRFERKIDPELGPKFLRFVKSAFAFRRKFLLKNLKSLVDKEQLLRMPEIFAELGLKPSARAEELAPDDFVRLYKKVYER